MVSEGPGESSSISDLGNVLSVNVAVSGTCSLAVTTTPATGVAAVAAAASVAVASASSACATSGQAADRPSESAAMAADDVRMMSPSEHPAAPKQDCLARPRA